MMSVCTFTTGRVDFSQEFMRVTVAAVFDAAGVGTVSRLYLLMGDRHVGRGA